MRKLAIWTIGLAVIAVGLLGIAAWVGLIDDYEEATLFLAGIAAVAAVAGSVITWLGNRTNAQHLQELAIQQQQAAADVRRLAELTESSLEEARAQKPEPVVQFIVGKEQVSSTGVIYTRRRFARSLDVEKIVAEQRQVALSTLPPETTPDEDDASRVRRRGISPAILAAITGLDPGPITSEERSTFQRRVEDYVSELRKWLRSYETYRQSTDPAVPIFLRFENRGRVPAKGCASPPALSRWLRPSRRSAGTRPAAATTAFRAATFRALRTRSGAGDARLLEVAPRPSRTLRRAERVSTALSRWLAHRRV